MLELASLHWKGHAYVLQYPMYHDLCLFGNGQENSELRLVPIRYGEVGSKPRSLLLRLTLADHGPVSLVQQHLNHWHYRASWFALSKFCGIHRRISHEAAIRWIILNIPNKQQWSPVCIFRSQIFKGSTKGRSTGTHQKFGCWQDKNHRAPQCRLIFWFSQEQKPSYEAREV